MQEGPPLAPLGEVLMEVKDGATLVQEDSAAVEERNSAAVEYAA